MNISKEDLIKKFDGTSLEPKPVILVVHFKEVLNLLQKDMLPFITLLLRYFRCS